MLNEPQAARDNGADLTRGHCAYPQPRSAPAASLFHVVNPPHLLRPPNQWADGGERDAQERV